MSSSLAMSWLCVDTAVFKGSFPIVLFVTLILLLNVVIIPVVQVKKPGEVADVANDENDTRQENSATAKSTKKKPKKEDKWKQKMMFLYEDGANADEDVSEMDSTETEAVADSRLFV